MDGRQVIVLEKNARIGEETSSRNSQVIHAGIYYASGSLKARLCVEGKERLYAYCEQKGVAYRRCGKIIVAMNELQLPKLEALHEQALSNDVYDLEYLDTEAIHQREPVLNAPRALWSPSTGIVDAHALMLALQGDLENAGGLISVQSEFHEAHYEDDVIRLLVTSGGEITELRATTVINAAGLHASRVARAFRGTVQPDIPETRYAKGNYFTYNGRSPFEHLVYPLPVDGGLGIHATLDLAGRVRFGPDVEWVDDIDYEVDPRRAVSFYKAIRSYWPSLADDSLSPDYAGVRPKLNRAGETPADFRILGPIASGEARAVHLFGIESPGLTASLAIGEEVLRLLS